MRKAFFVILMCLSVYSCIRINPQYAGIEKLHTEYKLNEIDLRKSNLFEKDSISNRTLYRMDAKVLQNTINRTPKQYILLYSMNLFCSSPECLYYDTIKRQFYENKDVELLLLSPDNPFSKISIESFFEDYPYPVFMLDCNRYGNERNLMPDYRFISFLSEINPATSLEESSNAFLLIDKNMKILLEGYYNSDTKRQIMNLIK